MTCSFFGHRDIDISTELYEKTKTFINQVFQNGCKNFLFGGFGDFDKLCYDIVTELKLTKDKSIQRIFCVPQERYLRKRATFFNRDKYDDVVYLMPRFEGWYKSIYYRNIAMIDQSNFVLFYAQYRENSGAYKAYKYAIAKQNEKIILNLAI